jgi:hypothetical protein
VVVDFQEHRGDNLLYPYHVILVPRQSLPDAKGPGWPIGRTGPCWPRPRTRDAGTEEALGQGGYGIS